MRIMLPRFALREKDTKTKKGYDHHGPEQKSVLWCRPTPDVSNVCAPLGNGYLIRSRKIFVPRSLCVCI